MCPVAGSAWRSPSVAHSEERTSLSGHEGAWHCARIKEIFSTEVTLAFLSHGAVVTARCAEGLLLQPCVGDSVLCAQIDGQWRVLLVLERAKGQSASPAVLAVPGAQSLRIEADSLALASTHLDVSARQTTVTLGLVRLSAQVLRMAAQKVSLWADAVHTRARAVALRADMRVARIDGADVLHVQQLRTQADDLIRFDAKEAQVRAKDNVIVDGKRISLG